MNRKYIFSILMMIILGLGISQFCEAKQKVRSSTFPTMTAYFASARTVPVKIEYRVTVTTPQGVYYAAYSVAGLRIGDNAKNISWTGPGSAPILKIKDFDNNVGASYCPGINTREFYCGSYSFEVTVSQDDNGCPWLATMYSYSSQTLGSATYTSPTARSSVCPVVPIDTYDISWSPDFVQHEKVLSLTPTGGTINQTLPTYLMESGMLCDGSKFDSRGAYCRFVSTGITLTVLGCDNNSIVTTTATAHPITDRQLHDINVAVKTQSVGSGTTKVTCNFQYIIEQL